MSNLISHDPGVQRLRSRRGSINEDQAWDACPRRRQEEPVELDVSRLPALMERLGAVRRWEDEWSLTCSHCRSETVVDHKGFVRSFFDSRKFEHGEWESCTILIHHLVMEVLQGREVETTDVWQDCRADYWEREKALEETAARLGPLMRRLGATRTSGSWSLTCPHCREDTEVSDLGEVFGRCSAAEGIRGLVRRQLDGKNE